MTKIPKKKKLNFKKEGFYVHDEPLTIYKSGNSKVVTIPAEFPFEVGDEFSVSQIDNGLLFKLILKDTLNISSKIKKLHKIIGTENTPGIGDMSIEDLEKQLEGVYE